MCCSASQITPNSSGARWPSRVSPAFLLVPPHQRPLVSEENQWLNMGPICSIPSHHRIYIGWGLHQPNPKVFSCPSPFPSCFCMTHTPSQPIFTKLSKSARIGSQVIHSFGTSFLGLFYYPSDLPKHISHYCSAPPHPARPRSGHIVLPEQLKPAHLIQLAFFFFFFKNQQYSFP